MHMQTMILLRVSICSPVVSRSFAAFRLEEPNMPEDDSESTWRSIVVSQTLSALNPVIQVWKSLVEHSLLLPRLKDISLQV